MVVGRAPGPWTIREALLSDLPDLAALERACFSTPWSETSLRLELRTEEALVLVARRRTARAEGPAVGYAAFRTVVDETELLRIAVHPEARRTGLGRALVTTGLHAAACQGSERCLLEVGRANAAAIALYRALGFTDYGIRPAYYADGQDALLMERPVRRDTGRRGRHEGP